MRAVAVVILVLLSIIPPTISGSNHEDHTASGEIVYEGSETGELVVIMATIMDCGCVGDISPFIGPVEEWLNISDDFRYVEFGQRGTQDIWFHRHAADNNFGNGDGEVDVGEALLIWDGLVNVGQFRGWGQGQHEIPTPTFPQSISYLVPEPEREVYFWAYLDSNNDNEFSAGDPWGESCDPLVAEGGLDFGTITLEDRGIVATNCLPRPGMYGMIDGNFGTSFEVPRPVPPLESFIGPVVDPSPVEFIWEGKAWFNETEPADQHTFYFDHEVGQHDGNRTVRAPGWYFDSVDYEIMERSSSLNENRTEWTWEMVENEAFTELELTFVRELSDPAEPRDLSRVLFSTAAIVIVLIGLVVALVIAHQQRVPGRPHPGEE